MTTRILAISSILLGLAASADAGIDVSTFEDVGLTTPNSYFNATPSLTDPTSSTTTTINGQFNSGGNSFNNSYTYYPQYSLGTWSGWSISNQTNIANPNGSIPDYHFQYASVTGSGANGSQTYAVADTFGPGADPLHPATSIVNLASGASPTSVQVTNTAYDYYSMIYGDGFAHKFGAGDFLLLTVDGYTSANGQGSKLGEVDFYLANFLGTDPSQYVIVDTWQTLNLGPLAGASSLVFGLESSDNSIYGMNTPAGFALDNLTVASAVPEPSSLLPCLTGFAITALVVHRARTGSEPL